MASKLKKFYDNLGKIFNHPSRLAHKRIASKISPPGQTGVPVGTAQAFLRHSTTAYASQLASYGQYSRLARYSDFCIAGETKVWTLDHGPVEIEKLCEMYPNGEKFRVYSYDRKNGKVAIDTAHHPRPTKVDMTYKVNFDSGGYIIANDSHEFMMRDGSYREVKDLKSGDSLMPFYRGLFGVDKYSFVNTLSNDNKNNRKWQPEHVFIMEQLSGRFLNGRWNGCDSASEKEVVHHKNFKSRDNRPANLKIMTEKDHQELHKATSIVNNKKRWEDPLWREKHSRIHSKFMKENNPAFLSNFTFDMIDDYCKSEVAKGNNRLRNRDVLKYFGVSDSALQYRVKKQGYKNFSAYMKSIDPEWKHAGTFECGKLHSRYNKFLTFQKICDVYKKGMSMVNTARKFGVSCSTLKNRLRDGGFKNWVDFRENYENHKIVSIESYKKIQVYDLTTDVHHNFAAGTEEVWLEKEGKSKIMHGFVFISNSEMESISIVSTALDIYADESTVRDEYGNILTIESPHDSIRRELEVLFHDTLNMDFNAWTWIRSLSKYGDQFLLLDHHPEAGIIGLFPMPVNEVEREEGFNREDPTAYRFRWITQGNRIIDPWMVAHFRIAGNDAFTPYGASMIEPARRPWRQLTLLEDAIMVYRIVRCVGMNTNVWTDGKHKKIKDLKIGDKVRSYDYENNKLVTSSVTNVVNNGKQQIWKVKSLHRTIRTNFNHPVLVRDKKYDKIYYVQVHELEPKRFQLVLPREEDKGKKIPIALNEEKYEWVSHLSEEGREIFKNSQYENSIRSMCRQLAEQVGYIDNRIRQFLYGGGYGDKNQGKGVKAIPCDIAKKVCAKFNLSEEYLIKHPKGMYNLDRLGLPEYVDEEFARFFGFMVGDGFLTKNLHKMGFATRCL